MFCVLPKVTQLTIPGAQAAPGPLLGQETPSPSTSSGH